MAVRPGGCLNGHSFRYCDPFDVAGDARQQVIGGGGGGGGSGATCDRELMNINLAMCRMVYPKQERFNKSSLEAFDPISPTQAPPNYTLVRGNREYMKALKFRP